MKGFWKSGELFVWLTASGVAISLLMIAGLLGLIMVNGLGQFWPQRIEELRLHDGQRFIGQVTGREIIPGSETRDRPEGQARIRMRIGNRDAFGFDFKWIDESAIATREAPEDVIRIERREWGPAFGRIVALHDGPGANRSDDRLWPALQVMLANARETQRTIDEIEHDRIGAINHEIETLRLKRRALTLDGTMTPNEAARDAEWNHRISTLEETYQEQTAQLETLYKNQAQYRIGLELSDGGRSRFSYRTSSPSPRQMP